MLTLVRENPTQDGAFTGFATPVDRRRSPRQALVAPARLRSDSVGESAFHGFVRDISHLGIGLHTTKSVQVGRKLQLRIEAGPMRWSSRIRVVSCKWHESGVFDVGAEFVDKHRVNDTEMPMMLAA